MMKFFYAFLSVTFLALPARAGELAVAIGYEDLLNQSGKQSYLLNLDYRGDETVRLLGHDVHFVAGLRYDGTRDLWLGFGGGIKKEWKNGWWLESSLMAGRHWQGEDGSPLGHPIAFKSIISFNKRLSDGNSIGIAFDHLSNGFLGDKNPGVEGVYLRFSRQF